MLLTYNNIINNINCIHKVFLNLKCVLNVLTQNIFQDWMNLPYLFDYKPSDFFRNLDLYRPKTFPTKGFGL